MAPDDTKQTEKSGAAYPLTDGERAVMQSLHMAIVVAKAKMHDTQAELTAAEATFSSGLAMLANSHGMGGGTLTPDFAAIIKKQ